MKTMSMPALNRYRYMLRQQYFVITQKILGRHIKIYGAV
jgi:hypothetical protein